MRTWKFTSGIGAAVLTACLAGGPGIAAPHGGGGGGGGGAPHIGGGGGGAPHFGGGGGGAPHFGGGGMPHIGGGAPHIGGGMPHIGGGAPHFGGGGMPHIGGGVPHIGGGAPHIAAGPHISAPHFAPHGNFGRHGGIAHVGPRTHIGGIGHGLHGPTGTHVGTANHGGPPGGHGTAATHGTTHNANLGNGNAANNAARTAGLHASANRVTGAAAPQAFAAHRDFAHVRGLRPFFVNDPWRRHHHLGWIGPLFWPYAYGDLFYYALWPYEYDYYDPFWAYGYDDIYEGIFPPYSYSSYLGGYGSYGRGYGSYGRGRGGGASARLTTLTKSVAQSCTDEAAEVTGWPIDQIQDLVQPNGQQKALLDDLGNAIVKASDAVKSHCPTRVSFTAPDRLADMQQRLEGLVQAVGIVQPPLAKFYDSLSDEQKARFNALGEPSGQNGPQGQQAAQNPQSQCGENAVAWPADRIDQVVHPTDAQHAKLDALNAAAAQAADTIKAACPSELPATPPDRLAAEGKRLQAMLDAVETIRPKLDDFYASLSNEQKARFNTIGRQLFAAR
jgi:LTXXQ motif family protein